VFQNLDILERYPIEHVVVLAGDHVYKMDYAGMLAQHVDSGAHVTVGCVEVPREEAIGLGVVRVDAGDRVRTVIEKPNDPPGTPDDPDRTLASMGIYVFDARFLYDQLRRDAADPHSSHDLGRDVIAYLAQHGTAVAHRFSRSAVRSDEAAEDYWRDVGTLDAFFEANLDLVSVLPALDLYDRRWPVWTVTEMLPPAKFVHDEDGRRGTATSSLVANGCIVSGARVRRSLLSTGVRVHSFADLDGAVVMPHAEIGRGARLRDVIVDSGARVPPGLVVGADPDVDAHRFRRTEKGVCLITQPMLDRLP
jgi:glucose-1-phosphate adenylyltransferase